MDSTADVVEKPGDEGTAGDRAENDLQSQTQDDSVLRERPDVQPHLADSADSDIKEEDVEHDRAEVEHDLAELHAHAIEGISLNEAIAMWHRLETLTSMVSERLTEQLRLVLEASLASRMSGDYRTGKRLNMRKIIPYIASQFRKDKIWLRRSKPSKREYQV
jgi:midasin